MNYIIPLPPSPLGLSLAQPCTNIDIIRQDTRETVEQSVVYLDQDISEVRGMDWVNVSKYIEVCGMD